MTSTQREKKFANSPLKEYDEWKSVNTLGGIGDRAAAIFKSIGYSKAYHIVGQYLILGQDEELFKQWLADIMEKGGHLISFHHMDSCYNSIKMWCSNNL